MTKYVLNSGGLRNNPQGATKFFAELLAGKGDNPKVLLCLFAQPREIWETKFEQYTNDFKNYLPQGVKPEYTMAFPDKFAEQVKAADVIYCHGGDDHLVQYWFKKVGVPEVWEGKTVGTNSASTNALAKHYWTCDWRELGHGLGVLPIKVLPHFESDFGNDDSRGPIDWSKAKAELETYGDVSLPVHALKEGEFVIIEQ
jgi:hypothetical protein